MKNKIIILMCIVFIQSCAHIEKKSKSCNFEKFESKNTSIKEDLTRD